MKEKCFVFIGNFDKFLVQLVEPLIRAGFSVKAIVPPGSSIKETKGVAELIEIPYFKNEQIVDYLISNQEIIDGLEGIFLWSTDELMYLVSRSDLPEQTKDRILPMGNPRHRNALGSKSGQISLFKESGANYPETMILQSRDVIPDSLPSGDVFLKGDRDGGGRFVMQVTDCRGDYIRNLDDDWFPLTIQEEVKGHLYSVEAFYYEGRLVTWMYSMINLDVSKFGASVSRTYQMSNDQELLRYLIAIGKRGKVSGLVNVGLVKEAASGRHLIFEFDARLNKWHYLFEFFEIPLFELIADTNVIGFQPALSNPVELYEPYRFFKKELLENNLRRCVQILFRSRISGFGVPTPSIFYRPKNLFFNWLRLLFFPLERLRAPFLKLGVVAIRAIPPELRRSLDSSALKNRLVKALQR